MEIQENGVKSLPIAADVTRAGRCNQNGGKFNTIDILVNNVGTFIGGACLASKASDYITGQVVFVDGSFSAQ